MRCNIMEAKHGITVDILNIDFTYSLPFHTNALQFCCLHSFYLAPLITRLESL